MNRLRVVFAILCMLPFGKMAVAQSVLPQALNDSLWAVWNNQKEADTSRLKAMHDIAREGYLYSRPDSAFHYASLELALAEKKKLPVQMAAALNTQGASYFMRGNYTEAMPLYERSLALSQQANDPKGMATAYTNIGLIKRRQGENALALEYYQKSVTLQEQVGNEKGMALTFNNIATVLYDLGDVRKALEYHHRALGIYERLGDKRGMSGAYGNLGSIHSEQGEKTLALGYMEKALELSEAMGDRAHMATTCHNIGITHRTMGNNEKALEYLLRNLQLLQEMGDTRGISGTYNSIGSVYYQMKDLPRALEFVRKGIETAERAGDKRSLVENTNNLAYMLVRSGSERDLKEALALAQRSMGIAKELGFPEKIKNAAWTQTQIHRKQGRYKEALDMYDLYIAMRDSTLSEENKKELMRQRFQYDYDKKEALLAVEQEKKDAIADEELKRRSTYLAAATVVTFVLGLMFLVIFFAYRSKSRVNSELEVKNSLIHEQKLEVERQKAEVDVRNREIMQSFDYARRLQEAVMPGTDALQMLFADSFLFNRPRDVVSGDFYWMARHKGVIYLAVGDCTGHGVPGAMLSVIGLNSLNRCISDLGLTRPKDVLTQMTLDLLVTFEGSVAQVRDGMDIALCAIDTKAMTITFAGAHNPLWIARHGEMHVIKGDRRAVGYHDSALNFTQQEVGIETGDAVYLFSDGFQDQMGGSGDKKYMTRRFREFLLGNSHLPMNGQHLELSREFAEWRGTGEQTDDVCVMGVRIHQT
ncbi:MAG: tetratricopeptide repeat protein [Flavobacteriales bacterium]|nr:tetratricopeptide repeat protein [Flavobacteriales bacterium]